VPTDARDRSATAAVIVALALVALTTGPLYRVRSWWAYDDPLATDPVVVTVHALFGVAAATWMVTHRRSVPVTAALVLAGAVSGWLLLSTLWSTDPGTTLREALQIASALLVGMAGCLALGRRWFAGALWVAVHVGLAWSFIAIQTERAGTQDARGDWAGIFFNRNSLGLTAALGILLGVVILIDGRAARSRPLAVDGVVAVVLLIDARLLLGSAARTPWVAVAAAGAGAVGVLGAHRLVREGRSATAVAAIGGAVLAALGGLAWLTRHQWLDDLGRSSDLTGRAEVWDVAVDTWRQRPILGHGYLARWSDPSFVAEVEAASGHLLTSAHNAFVEVLLGAGAIGLILFVGFIAALWMSSVTDALERPTVVATATVAVLVFVVVENLTETLFVGNQLAVALLGAIAVAAGSSRSLGAQSPVRVR
jgi:O-antigen ligase